MSRQVAAILLLVFLVGLVSPGTGLLVGGLGILYLLYEGRNT